MRPYAARTGPHAVIVTGEVSSLIMSTTQKHIQTSPVLSSQGERDRERLCGSEIIRNIGVKMRQERFTELISGTSSLPVHL